MDTKRKIAYRRIRRTVSNHSNEAMTVPEFIKQVYIDEIGEISAKHHYLSIMLMMMGIEFLGRCADPSNPLDHYDSSYGRKRFNAATNDLFPTAHKTLSNSLNFYSRLRNGFAHKAKPSVAAPTASAPAAREIYLAGPDCSFPHLYEDSGCIIIRSDGLYSHFKDACEECIRRINNGTYTKTPFDLKSGEYLCITPIPDASLAVGSLSSVPLTSTVPSLSS